MADDVSWWPSSHTSPRPRTHVRNYRTAGGCPDSLFEVTTTPLGEVLKSWKGDTAREADRLLGRKGAFWEKEYRDRSMRDDRHFR